MILSSVPTRCRLFFCVSLYPPLSTLNPFGHMSAIRLRHFFAVWDTVEQIHPWGVERLQPLLVDFGVPDALCAEIDSRLFIDLMITRYPDLQRIRVEGRHSRVVFWVQVEGIGASDARVTVAFQRTPAHAFDCVASVAARPAALMACLAAHHRAMLVAGTRRGALRCRRGTVVGNGRVRLG